MIGEKEGEKVTTKKTVNIKRLAVCILVFLVAISLFVYLIIPKGKSSYTKQGKYAELIQGDVLYHIDRVIDGDTVVANVEGHELTLRLIGIDTPEVVDPRKPVQCYGKEASAEAKELLLDKDVYLEREQNREAYDKYARVLAYIFFFDKTSYNEFMIEKGFAGNTLSITKSTNIRKNFSP